MGGICAPPLFMVEERNGPPTREVQQKNIRKPRFSVIFQESPDPGRRRARIGGFASRLLLIPRQFSTRRVLAIFRPTYDPESHFLDAFFSSLWLSVEHLHAGMGSDWLCLGSSGDRRDWRRDVVPRVEYHGSRTQWWTSLTASGMFYRF